MNGFMFGVSCFSIGAAVGVLATMKFFEDKYAKIADEEVASVKRVYSRKTQDQKAEEKPTAENSEAPENPKESITSTIDTYVSKDTRPDYTVYSTPQIEDKKVTTDMPYVIDPTDAGEYEDYEAIELTYYRDGILAENDTDIVNINDVIGFDPGEHFGDYEADRVYVRDDRRQVEYEIIRDERTFMEVL